MDKKNELIYIAQNPSGYLKTMGKTLESRLEEIKLTNQEEKDIIKEKTLQTVRDKGLALFGGIGDVVSTVLSWNDQVNEEMAEAKKMVLLEQYFNKSDDQEKAINMLKEFLMNPQGNTLFNKILRLLDDSPPDEELMKHLSSILKTIIDNGDFESLFTQHKYALAQLERLTPQALTIISDHKQWPLLEVGGGTMAYGPKITSDWYAEFAEAYCKHKGVMDEQKYKRVVHSVLELQRQGFMEAYKSGENHAFCELTVIGKDLLVYIS